MNILFLLLRLATGLLVVGALLILLAIVLMRSGAAFVKESAGVLGYVIALFTSGFTKGTPPKEPAGWVASLPQAGLAVLFLAMLVTLFLPGARTFLHIVAAMTGLAAIWYGQMFLTEMKPEILCAPALIVWLVYYLMCVCWFVHPPGSAGN